MRLFLSFRLITHRLAASFLFTYISLMSTFFLLDTLVRRFHRFDALILMKNFIGLAFVKADIFVPFAFLLALIYTISSLKQSGEMQTLQMCGLSKRFLTFPFYLVAFMCALFSYVNNEYIIAKVTPWVDLHRKMHKTKGKEIPKTRSKQLEDGSRIVYQKNEQKMFDLYWIRSHDEIWHCKEVILDSPEPEGLFVDVFKKGPSHLLEKTDSMEKVSLPPFFFSAKETAFRKKAFRFSKTAKMLLDDSLLLVSDRAKMQTHFLYRLMHPLYPFLFATGFLPWLFSYQRSYRPYLIYLIGLILFLIFYSIIKTCIILGESYIVSPWMTLVMIPIFCQGVLTYRLWKT